MKKIGLLGGSFDPPHKGHLFISLEAKKILKLDEVWWLVTPKNPLKISEPASYVERVNNCKNITRNFPIKIQEIDKTDNRIALIIGAEGKGLRNLTKQNVDGLVKIDINPKCNSLNASNAAAVAMYEIPKN